jgi:hypothetical protein
MSIEIITIGPTPTEENCAQIRRDDYESRSRRECTVFKRMLERLFPIPEGVNASLFVKLSDHDFGRYREVSVRFDDSDRQASDYAYKVERESPVQWDDAARYELMWYGRQDQYSAAVRQGTLDSGEVPLQYQKSIPDLPAGLTLLELLKAHPL